MFKFYLYKFGQFCVNHLPTGLIYAITTFISDMQYYLSPRDRKAVKNNLRVILRSNKNVSPMAREVFRNFGKYLADFFRMSKKLTPDYIQRHITIEHAHYFDQVLKEGKGGIILTAHIGNWELGGIVISMLGYPLVAVALPHRERPVNDLFNHQRETKGITIVQTNGAIRRCVEALKANKFVALLADRDFGVHGELMDFLGKKAFIPKGPAVFSLKTGAPIIPAFLIYKEDGTFRMFLEEPIYPVFSGTEEESIRNLMRQYTAVIEDKIRQYPTQWLMFRRFWPT